MEIIYLLIPISLILLALIVWILLWAVRDGQYDDLEGPAYRILMDEDKIVERDVKPPKKSVKKASKKNSRREDAG
jgi:cbb3-type cytochrome oxidase maturation protein